MLVMGQIGARRVDQDAVVQAVRLEQESVRVACVDLVWRESLGRKVALVESDDTFRMPDDGGGENMPIARIGKRQRRDDALISGHAAVRHRTVDLSRDGSQFFNRDIRAFLMHGRNPLVVDVLRPPGTEQPRRGQLHDEATQRRSKKTLASKRTVNVEITASFEAEFLRHRDHLGDGSVALRE